MDAAAFLSYLLTQPDYRQQIVHVERIPRKDATPGKLEERLDPRLERCLEAQGISDLYSHQAQALNAVFSGKNVIVATPSASGKTLVYHLATLRSLLEDKNSRALYLFPTKALAQDQLRSLRQMVSLLSSSGPGNAVTSLPDSTGSSSTLRAPTRRDMAISAAAIATFDGDTPQPERAGIRTRARVVLTNPDMLHLGILPNHQSWSALFRN
ncbi:MAG: DEAD/DEAH box helicase, partial [Dehalococcoidia bacterium]